MLETALFVAQPTWIENEVKQMNRHPKDSPKKKEKKISVAKTRALWEKMGMTQNVEEAIPRKSRATRKEPGGIWGVFMGIFW